MSTNVYVIQNTRTLKAEDVVVGTSSQFKDWIVSQPKYLGSADPEDMRESLDEEMNVKKDSIMLGSFEIRIYTSPTVLGATGGRRRKTRKQKSRK